MIKKTTPEEEQIAALNAAGRLLESPQWPGGAIEIKPLAGETYEQAVTRVVATLAPAVTARLRSATSWIREYERYTPAPRPRREESLGMFSN